MALKPYKKAALDYPDQLQQLKTRGLKIDNEPKVRHLLENVSYYRLSGYWYPLLHDKENHVFKPDATFDDAFSLYCFDSKLRRLVMAEIEKIEIAIRAKMVYFLSMTYTPFWYGEPKLFPNGIGHSSIMSKLTSEFGRSDEEFMEAFKNKYSDPLPPSWMLLEVSSFGTLSQLYKHLGRNRSKRDIANYFGLDEDTFGSWIHAMVYIRNVCAHHGRLWNRVLKIKPRIALSAKATWLTDSHVSNKRMYYFLSVLMYLLNTINPKHTFKTKFLELVKAYTNVDLAAMGFPPDWEKEPLWS